MIKLTFTCTNGKRYSEQVPIEVANTVPLFATKGISDYCDHRTTLSALSLYWKCFKRQQTIPSSTTLQERIDFVKLIEYLGEELYITNTKKRKVGLKLKKKDIDFAVFWICKLTCE